MPKQLENKNSGPMQQDNIVKDLQDMLKGVTLLADDREKILEKLLMYIVARDLRVFLHGHTVGASSARSDTINSNNYNQLHNRSDKPQPVL